MVATPSRSNAARTRLLPVAIPPVSATRRIRPAGGGSLTRDRLGDRRVLRGDPFLDERIPLVALRALPQQLGAAITAAKADVRIEVEEVLADAVAGPPATRLAEVSRR